MARRLSALRSLRLSLTYVTSFLSPHLPPCCLFAASCLWSLHPAFSSISLPTLPTRCGRLARIPRLWTWVWLWRRYLENFELLVGGRGGGGAGGIGQKSSELSSHQILVGGELGQFLHAERSSNPYARVRRTNILRAEALIKSRSESSSDKILQAELSSIASRKNDREETF